MIPRMVFEWITVHRVIDKGTEKIHRAIIHRSNIHVVKT